MPTQGMTYGLVLALKNAGFPLKKNPFSKMDTLEPEFISPTLEEIVEACGENFLGVERTYNVEKGKDNSWEATQKTWCCDEHGESRKYGYGPTPLIAVANLWLALNK